jgi:hypothetical protein
MNLMRISVLLIASLVVHGCAEPAVEDHAEEAQGIHGGWIVSEWVMPENEVMAMPAEHGLFLFTESGQYSMMWVPSADRPILPTPAEEASDAQLAEAYMGFVANSGRYTATDEVITYEAYIARDPAYMSRFELLGGEGNARSLNYMLNEDGTLTLEFVTEDEYGAGVVATLRRPGSASQD